jgi:hypothetical protein
MPASVGFHKEIEMSRVYTQQELNAFLQAEPELRQRGLEVDDQRIGNSNATQISEYFDNNPSIFVTVPAILAAVGVLKDQLSWKSPDQIGYEELHAGLSSQEQAVFKEFRYGRLKDTYANAFRLLKFLKDRRMPVSERNLQIAAGQLGRGLEYDNPTTSRESRYGRYSGQKFNVKDEDDRTYVNGRKNHAADPDHAPQHKPAASNGYWQAKAESVRVNTHSQTAAIQRMFVNFPDGSVDWHATFTARDRAASGRRGSI